MDPRKCYNTIIEEIENQIRELHAIDCDEKITDTMICDNAFSEAGYLLIDRDRNVLFNFLLGQTSNDYVSERRMNEACRVILELRRWKFPDDVIAITGVSDQASFCRKFKKKFAITPSQAFNSHDKSLLSSPIYWENIGTSKDIDVQDLRGYSLETKKEKFGISREIYLRAKLAENLQSLYNLPEMESELAFSLAEKQDVSLEEAFEYVYNYAWHWLGADLKEIPDDKDLQTQEDLQNTDVLYLYFDCGMGFNDICRILTCKKKGLFARELSTYDLLYLRGRFYNQEEESQYEVKYSWFTQHRTNKHTVFDYCCYQYLTAQGLENEEALKVAGMGCDSVVNDLIILEHYDEYCQQLQLQQAEELYNKQMEEEQILLQYYGVEPTQMDQYNAMQWDESDDEAYYAGNEMPEDEYDFQQDSEDDFAQLQYEDSEETACTESDDPYLYEYQGHIYNFNDLEDYDRFCQAVDYEDIPEEHQEEKRMTLYASLYNAEMVSDVWLHSSEYISCPNKESYSTFGFRDPWELSDAQKNSAKTDDAESQQESVDCESIECDMPLPF